MKKTFLLLVSFLFIQLLVVSAQEKREGTVEVNVSYFFNKNQGYKPDVNAKVFLFKDTQQPYIFNSIGPTVGFLKVEGNEQSVKYDYQAKANSQGVATIQKVPYGTYLLIVAGEGRKLYSKKIITVDSEKYIDTKNFGYKGEYGDAPEEW